MIRMARRAGDARRTKTMARSGRLHKTRGVLFRRWSGRNLHCALTKQVLMFSDDLM
jgi:hypothetical protein